MNAQHPFFRSIRFRMTAWYACLLILTIFAIGLALTSLLERELRQDVDRRLIATAADIKSQVSIVGNPNVAVRGFVPPPEAFSFPGLLIQIVNADNTPQVSSENLGGKVLPAAVVKQAGTNPVFQTGVVDGVTVRTVHLPLVLRENGRTIGAVNVGEPLLQLDQTIDHLKRIMVIIVIIGVGGAVAGGWFLAGRVLQPVDRITAAARSIALEQRPMQSLSTRLDVPTTGDELARLAATFNQMLDRIEQAFIGQRRFTADASHELRTPLTAIRGNTDVLLRQAQLGELPTRDDLVEALGDVQRETDRMGRLLQDLLILARVDAEATSDAVHWEQIDLTDIVRQAVQTARALTNGQRIDFEEPGSLMAEINPDHFHQVLLILLENAIRHTPTDGEIHIALTQENDNAKLSIIDTGEGISPEHLPHIFDRFYRADGDGSRTRDRGGTGLGLAIAKSIVGAYGGDISAMSTVGQGTTFVVKIPIAQTTNQVANYPPVPIATRGV